jgi:hypothetical protein
MCTGTLKHFVLSVAAGVATFALGCGSWNGASWMLNSVTGPPARQYHAMAALKGSVVLFGGMGSDLTILGDTWTWDGTSWTQHQVVGPSARYYHAMATMNDTVVRFGGQTSSQTMLADTWVWNGTSWAQENVTGPSARGSAADGDPRASLASAGAVDRDVEVGRRAS